MYRIFLLLLLSLGIMAPSTAQTGTDMPLCPLPTGLSEQTLISGEDEREYLLYIPENFDGTQTLPLVISLHGFAANPQQQMDWTRFNVLAEEENFIVVYPHGTGFPARWYAGTSNFQAQSPDTDVVFIGDLMDFLIQNTCADASRIYISGFSNGGGMTHRLACQMADRFAAAGTVAGAYATVPEGCNPSQPVPFIAFHGTDDGVVAYNGSALGLPNISTWVQGWAQRNGCDPQPEVLPEIGAVSGIQYQNCDQNAPVVFYTINGGGHTWPGSSIGLMALTLGEPNQDIDASAIMWEFFTAYRRG